MKQRYKNIYFILFINIIILIQLFYLTNSSICTKELPFLKDNECVSFCSTDELKSKNCSIDEEINKIKFLTNLVILGGEKDYRYININSNLNNDMVIQTSKSTGSGDRFFYGLKGNGRFFFKDENQKEFPFLFFSISGEETLNQQRYEGESSFIQISNTNSSNNVFFISIAKGDQYTELFDFNNNEYNFIKTEEFYKEKIYSDRGTFLKLTQIDENIYHYLIAEVIQDNDVYKCYMKKLYFNSKIIRGGYQYAYIKNINCTDNKMISCFETELNNIMCFYRNIDEDDNLKYFYISVYESLSSEIGINKIVRSESSEVFYKGIHLKKEIGVFVYFLNETEKFPYLSFKYFDNENSNLEDFNSFSNIILNGRELSKTCMINDIIKISDNYICYASVDIYKTSLYILTFNLFKNDTKMNIKYYFQSIKDINNYKIYRDIRLSLYSNQYIALGTSVCASDSCSNDNDEHYVAFVIFNYPNSTDVEIDLIKLLYETNEEINKINFNLEEYTLIESNLFGYVVKGIIILNYPENIKLISSKTNLEINKTDIISQNESFTLSFSSNDIYNEDDYIIEYALVATEDSFYNSLKMIMVVDKVHGGDDEINYYERRTYIGKSSYYNIKIEKDLFTNCIDNNICSLCLFTDQNYCITCKSEYSFEEGEKICEGQSSRPKSSLNLENSIIQNYQTISFPSSSISLVNGIIECTIEKIIENKCKEGIATNKQIEDIYNNLKDNLINKEYDNENKIIETQNVVFQISTLEQQNNNTKLKISSIDLGECENIIKQKEGLSENDELIIFKTDIRCEDSTYVQYEVCHPITLVPINLSICDKNTISINVPVYLDQNIEEINDDMYSYGYNIFDENDTFYNDICSKYTTENGTDLTLNDRRSDMYGLVSNISLCQEGCNYEYYNSSTKKAKCNCEIQEKKNIIDNIESIKNSFKPNENLLEIFEKTLSYSNFKILSCFKVLKYFKNFINNYGCIIMSIILIIFITLMLKYFIYDQKVIKKYIETVIENNFSKTKSLSNKNFNDKIDKSDKIDKNNRKINKAKSDHNIIIYKENIEYEMNNENIFFPPRKKSLKLSTHLRKKSNESSSNRNTIKSNTLFLSSLNTNKNSTIDKFKKEKNNLKNSNKGNNCSNNKYENLNTSNNHNNICLLNDTELNRLEYKKALKLDKRTYCAYYYSILKTNHIILFTFVQRNDYNILTIKICLLILSFSLYFTINGFFFTDETMHNIYIGEGVFNFLEHLPKIIYSSAISIVIQQILKLLSLSEKNILNLKKEKSSDAAIKKSKTIHECLKIKFIIFYILGLFLILFFWYFITLFCYVYSNTQIILIKDIFISFFISLLYPFGLSLVPGLFRIPALNDKKKDKEYMYKIGLFISLI